MTAIKTGRNAPCLCGSGKKYKHCCLPKEQATERERLAATSKPLEPPLEPARAPMPIPVEKKAVDTRWEAFEAADYNAKIALYLQMLNESETMGDGMAYEMLSQIYSDSVEPDERERFLGLLTALRERLPDVYEEESPYFWDWQVSARLTAGQTAELPALMHELSADADRDIDLYLKLLDQLAYHGELPALVAAVEVAWPVIKDSSAIVPWGIEEFSQRAADYVIFDYLERQPLTTADDPMLLARLEKYLDIDAMQLERYLGLVSGRARANWTSVDFEPDADQCERHLADLSLAFLGYLKQTENVAYSKGELARVLLLDYLLERYGCGAKKHPVQQQVSVEQLLCPQHQNLDRFLAERLNVFNPQFYRVAAAFEFIPAWLRFLQTRRLIGAETGEETLARLAPLRLTLLQLYQSLRDDPSLYRALQAWPSAGT